MKYKYQMKNIKKMEKKEAPKALKLLTVNKI